MAKKKPSKHKGQPLIDRGFADLIANKKTPRVEHNVNTSNSEKPAWQLSSVDDGGKWGWRYIGKDRWERVILPKLKSYETMTWNEILAQNGGKTHGTNSHPIPISNLTKEAQERLAELRLDDMDDIFSLRVTSKTRIFGRRSERVLKIIWFDFNHEICPSTKR